MHNCGDRMSEMNKTTICGIVAVGPYDVIGKNGVMPWYSRTDFYHFKTLTTPWPCIFGKTTFENLPIRPLPNRLNIVCSSAYKNEFKDGVFYANSVESGIDFCRDYKYVFICGGRQIYKYALEKDLIDILYLTQIYDKTLEEKVCLNPGEYVKFPINTQEFLYSNKWVAKKMLYDENVLPKNDNDTITKFFKCVRVR